MPETFEDLFTNVNEPTMMEYLIITAMDSMKDKDDFIKEVDAVKKITIELKINGREVSIKHFLEMLEKTMDRMTRQKAYELMVKNFSKFHGAIDKMNEISDIVDRDTKEVLNLLGDSDDI